MTNWKRSIFPCVASVSCLLMPAVRGQTLTVPVQGAEQVTSGGTADLGSLTVTAAGYSESVSFGKFSSAASVASGLAAKFSLDCQSPVSAFAQGAQIAFTLKSSGTSVSISSAAQWDTADFSASSFHLPSASGGAPTPTPGQPTSSLSLDCTPDPAPAGAAVSCTAEMPAGVTGSLSFSVDGGPPSQVALSSGGTASLGALSGLTTGSHTVTANYSGDANYAATNQTATIQVLAGSLQPVPVYSFSITQPGSTTSGYAANGNLTAYTDSVNGQWSLGYDGLNRVTSAGSQGFANQAQQYMCWAYDSFGNRIVEATASSAFGGSCSSSTSVPTSQVSYNANNQITGGSAPTYDAGGNVTNDGTIQYLYDGEGRICAVSKGIMPSVNSMVQYIYDADGNRVAKGSIAVFSCDTTKNGFQPTAAYAVDQSGQQVTEMTVNNGQSSWAHTNLFAAGGLYATYDPQGLHYQINDWLGTRRVQTDAFGQVEENCQSLPFGNGLNCPPPTNAPTTAEDATEHHFTGKERDTESGLDYFGARYYSSVIGRFSSPDSNPDPQPVPFAELSNPQTLNLYAYVLNNPLSMLDADGHSACPGGSDFGGGNPVIAARPCYDEDPTKDTGGRALLPANADGRVIPGDLGLSWYVGGKLGGLLGEGALGLLDRLLGRTGAEVLTQSLEKLSPAEKAIVEELRSAGHTVTQIARGAGQTPDFLVDGVETELKTVTANGPNSVKNAIEKAASQTSRGNILIDARGSSINPAGATSQTQRAAGNLGASALKGRVTVMTKSGNVKF